MAQVESEDSDSDEGSEVDVVEEPARGKRSTCSDHYSMSIDGKYLT